MFPHPQGTGSKHVAALVAALVCAAPAIAAPAGEQLTGDEQALVIASFRSSLRDRSRSDPPAICLRVGIREEPSDDVASFAATRRNLVVDVPSTVTRRLTTPKLKVVPATECVIAKGQPIRIARAGGGPAELIEISIATHWGNPGAADVVVATETEACIPLKCANSIHYQARRARDGWRLTRKGSWTD
jgi:hypothetical protein